MTFRRGFSKALLAEMVSAEAGNRAKRLRASARRDVPGLYRDSKRAAASLADEIAAGPEPVVDLIKAVWDRQNPNREPR